MVQRGKPHLTPPKQSHSGNAPSSQQLPHPPLSRRKFQMLLGTAECPWSSPLKRKEWLSCHQKSFGRGCDHPELSRVTFTMRRRRAGCCRLLVGTAQAVPHLGVTAPCHHQAPHLPAPSTNPGLFHSSLLNSLALFKLLQLFQLLQLGLSNRSIFFKKK